MKQQKATTKVISLKKKIFFFVFFSIYKNYLCGAQKCLIFIKINEYILKKEIAIAFLYYSSINRV